MSAVSVRAAAEQLYDVYHQTHQNQQHFSNLLTIDRIEQLVRVYLKVLTQELHRRPSLDPTLFNRRVLQVRDARFVNLLRASEDLAREVADQLPVDRTRLNGSAHRLSRTQHTHPGYSAYHDHDTKTQPLVPLSLCHYTPKLRNTNVVGIMSQWQELCPLRNISLTERYTSRMNPNNSHAIYRKLQQMQALED